MINSFLRYVGGKSKALNTILTNLPTSIKEYREPMVGSGIVLLGLLQTRVRPEKIGIGDINYDIYNIWNEVINNPDGLMSEARKLIDNIKMSNSIEINTFGKQGVEAAAAYLLLNIRTRFGNYGGFISDTELLRKIERFDNDFKYKIYSVSNLVGKIEIHNKDYEWALTKDGEEVLVFLDPPYYKVSVSGGYYQEYNSFDYERFEGLLRTTRHKFVMTLDISEYTDRLAKYFNVQYYDIFYPMLMGYRKEALIKNF